MSQVCCIIPAFGETETALLSTVVNGIPLVLHTLVQARALDGVRPIVATDNEEISRIVEAFDGESAVLSSPAWWPPEGKTALSLLFSGCAGMVSGEEKVVVMDPCCPLRNMERLRGYLRLLEKRLTVATVFGFHLPVDRLTIGAADTHMLTDCQTMNLAKFDWMRLRGVFWGRNLAPMPAMDVYNNHFYALLKNPLETIRVEDASTLHAVQRIIEGGLFDFGGLQWP